MDINSHVQGIEVAEEHIIQAMHLTEKEVKVAVKDLGKKVRKRASSLAPVVRSYKGKRFKDRLASAMRRRVSEAGMTQTVDINTAKAPLGYVINEIDNDQLRTPWRKARRQRFKRQGHFMEAAFEHGIEEAEKISDSFTFAQDHFGGF